MLRRGPWLRCICSRERNRCSLHLLLLVLLGSLFASWRSLAAVALRARPALSPQSLESVEIKELKVIRAKLLKELQSVRLPPPTAVEAFGKEYTLPHKVKGPPLESLSADMLGYLSGFFAGDGCVHSNMKRLSVAQSIQGAAVLFLFVQFFGGYVGVQTSGSGTKLPVLHWQLSGPRSREAARMLSKAQLVKQEQLLRFAQSSPEGVRQLQKSRGPKKAVKFQSWHEVAGFVDADGRFIATARGEIELHFCQKYSASLEGLLRFFREQGVSARLSLTDGQGHWLKVCHGSMQKIAQALMAAGLLLKRVHVELVVNRSRSSQWVVRGQLRELNGNQRLWKRLDLEGRARATKIHSLQTKRLYLHLRVNARESSLEEIRELTEQIEWLKLEHEQKSLVHEVQGMRARLEELRSVG